MKVTLAKTSRLLFWRQAGCAYGLRRGRKGNRPVFTPTDRSYTTKQWCEDLEERGVAGC